MKIVFVGRSVYHFTYYESIVRELCKRGHTVKMIYDWNWSKNRPDEALQRCLGEFRNLSMEWGPIRNDRFRPFIFFLRELLSYCSYLSRVSKGEQSEFYLNRWRHYLPPLVRDKVALPSFKKILKKKMLQDILRVIEKLTPPAKNIVEFLKKESPDVVVASPVNMRFSEEVEYVKAAKLMGIPTVTAVLSWDNLSTKGLFHIIADLTLVWNWLHFKEAVEIHHVSPKRALIVGAYFFDKWFNTDHFLMNREDFCKELNISPYHPFVVYLGSSANIARDETWLVKEIVDSLHTYSNPQIKEMSVVIRPHPANAQIYEKIKMPNVVVYPKEGALPESEISQKYFFNTLYHSLGTIGINTSGMIDALILNRPCVSIITERYKNTQLRAIHFKYLLQSKALEIIHTPQEFPQKIESFLYGEDTKRKYREEFVTTFIRPYGRNISAGEVSACAIELMGKRWNAEEVVEKVRNKFLEKKMLRREERVVRS